VKNQEKDQEEFYINLGDFSLTSYP